MNQSLEATGRTVEEAIEAGLRELGIDRDDADVVVLSEGRSGLLGIGSEQARVRISVRSKDVVEVAAAAATEAEDAEHAREILGSLLRLMDIEAEIDVYIPEDDPATTPDSTPPIVLDILGDDAGLLIGRRGATLHDLQTLMTTMVSRTLKRYVPLRVDVEGYQERRLDQLRQVALRAADHVRQRRRPLTLDPMTPAERRVVHTTLAENPAVQTQSSGEGENRRVTISPSSGARPSRPPEGVGQRPGAAAPRTLEPPPSPILDTDEEEEEEDFDEEFEDEVEEDDAYEGDDEDDDDDDDDEN